MDNTYGDMPLQQPSGDQVNTCAKMKPLYTGTLLYLTPAARHFPLARLTFKTSICKKYVC
jgi:hypothetical protein